MNIFSLIKEKTRLRALIIAVKTSKNSIKRINRRYEFEVNKPVYLPLILKKQLPIRPELKTLSFQYKSSLHIMQIHIVITDKKIIQKYIPPCDKWKTVNIDISQHQRKILYILHLNNFSFIQLCIVPNLALSAANFQIRNIRLRPFTGEEAERDAVRKAYIERKKIPHIHLADYLGFNFPCHVTEVAASETEIVVSGAVCESDTDFYMVEVPIFSEFAVKEFHGICRIQPDNNNRFSVKISRKTDTYGVLYDRIYSRWAVAVKTGDEFALASPARYADTLNTVYSIPEIIPKNKKGLGAFKINAFESDLDELGISFITINIRLNNFLRTTAGKDNIPFEYNGVTYYTDRRKIEKYDAALLAAAKRNIIVHAIVLVYPENNSRDTSAGRILEHPEYDSDGAYTMPNLTNPASVNMYAAAIDFLASRYSRADKQFGHIHRWIVHNEIDAAWIWCNAGKKTAGELMDIYVKSMRLIYYTTFHYNSNTEVFISLTHYWQAAFNINCYPGAKMIDLLLEYSRVEGDFRWGVAYHPYPEQLTEPKSSLDPNATPDMNTKLITFKNVELLDKWVKQPFTYYKGERRRMVLSEQNPNSFDYSPQSLQEQADSLGYVMEKVKKCDGIEAYIAHSWIDARFEGGLKTGLRKYSDDPDDPYGKKPAWHVFKTE
jgi:hypothetical protein